MNDIFKSNIKARIEKAIEKEGVNQATAAQSIGIAACYVSHIKNPENWDKVPVAAWDEASKWSNSGQTLKEYAEKKGKVMPEQEGPEEHSPESVFEDKEPVPETVELKIEMGQHEYTEQVEMIPLDYHREQILSTGQKIRELTAQLSEAGDTINRLQEENYNLRVSSPQTTRDVKVNLIVKVKVEVEQ